MIATVGLPLISIVTPRRRLQNCLVSLVFQTITIMADVGLPLVSRRSLQRGDRRRPPFIFYITYLFHDHSPDGVCHPSILSCKLLAVACETKLTLSIALNPKSKLTLECALTLLTVILERG